MQEMKDKCFIGTEAEGPDRGKTILFIPGSVPLARVQAVLKKQPVMYQRIYYGAGNDRKIDKEVLEYIVVFAQQHNLQGVDIEIDDVGSFGNIYDVCGRLDIGYRIIFFDVLPIYHQRISYWKSIVGKTITWTSTQGPVQRVFYTSVDDPLFDEDVCIEPL